MADIGVNASRDNKSMIDQLVASMRETSNTIMESSIKVNPEKALQDAARTFRAG